jgi:16S rRNA C1402 (ribose-2'-O) methylase RsmI
MVLLLFNSFDDIVFHFVKAISELAEAFVEDTRHTQKHISDLLRHCCTKRRFKLRLHSSDNRFNVPLALSVEKYESIVEF